MPKETLQRIADELKQHDPEAVAFLKSVREEFGSYMLIEVRTPTFNFRRGR